MVILTFALFDNLPTKEISNDIWRIKRLESKSPETEEEETISHEAEEETKSHSVEEEATTSHYVAEEEVTPIIVPSLNDSATPIILSLLDPTYKQVMFAAFQQLGAKQSFARDIDEENRVKEETYNLLKSTGRKLMKYRNYRDRKKEFVEIDEKAARESK